MMYKYHYKNEKAKCSEFDFDFHKGVHRKHFWKWPVSKLTWRKGWKLTISYVGYCWALFPSLPLFAPIGSDIVETLARIMRCLRVCEIASADRLPGIHGKYGKASSTMSTKARKAVSDIDYERALCPHRKKAIRLIPIETPLVDTIRACISMLIKNIQV